MVRSHDGFLDVQSGFFYWNEREMEGETPLFILAFELDAVRNVVLFLTHYH